MKFDTCAMEAHAVRLRLHFEAWQQLQRAKGKPYSQAEAAARIGVATATLGRYLRGSHPMTPETIERIGRIVGATPDASEQPKPRRESAVLLKRRRRQHESRNAAERLKELFALWQRREREQGRPFKQADAAARLGWSQSQLSQYLRGVVPLNPNAFQGICALIAVSPDEVCGDLASRFAAQQSRIQERQKRRKDAVLLKGRFLAWQEQRRLNGKPYKLADVAAQIGWATSTLCDYLNGQVAMGPRALQRICTCIGAELADFNTDIGARIATTKSRSRSHHACREEADPH